MRLSESAKVSASLRALADRSDHQLKGHYNVLAYCVGLLPYATGELREGLEADIRKHHAAMQALMTG